MTTNCPRCLQPAIRECKCPLIHRTCEQKHVWFQCHDCGAIQVLDKTAGHKTLEMTLCTRCLNRPIKVT